MEDFRTLFFFLKFPRARERVPSKFVYSLDTCPQECSPVFIDSTVYTINY